MLKILYSLFFITLTGCQSTDVKIKSDFTLQSKEIRGIAAYKKGEYQQAFNLLKEPAAWGYKGSQYALAYLFLKGQYVKQSTTIGMAWLGVASEAKVDQWQQEYDKFYALATPELKLKIDEKLALYIKQFGMKAQHITCHTDTFHSMKSINCLKGEGVSQIHEVELTE